MEQRTEEWFNQRLGRFTSSVVSDLMGVKGLGETGKSLAFKKACEIVFGRDETWDIQTFDMKRGIEGEPEAFDLFQSMKAKQFVNVEKTFFFPLGKNSGASCDGLVGENSILEIKLPRPDKVFRIIKDGVSALDKSWIDQVQLSMKCTNSERCHFFVYCIWQGKPIWHELIIEKDEKHIELILERIEEAVVLRDQYVEELINQIQFEL